MCPIIFDNHCLAIALEPNPACPNLLAVDAFEAATIDNPPSLLPHLVSCRVLPKSRLLQRQVVGQQSVGRWWGSTECARMSGATRGTAVRSALTLSTTTAPHSSLAPIQPAIERPAANVSPTAVSCAERYRYRITDNHGESHTRAVPQMPQSAHRPLELPYTFCHRWFFASDAFCLSVS